MKTSISRVKNSVKHVLTLAAMFAVALVATTPAMAQDVEPIEVITASQWSTFVTGIGTALTGPITSVLQLAFGLLIVGLVVRVVRRYAFKG